MRAEHLEDFVRCFNPADRHERTETERFRPFTYDELVTRDKDRSTSPGSATTRSRTPRICRRPR
jgi:hypothetical protein